MKRCFKITLLLALCIFCVAGCGKKENTTESTKQAKVDALSKKSQMKEVVNAVLKDKSSEDFPSIDYISEDMTMFHTNRGFFVFDRSKKTLTTAIDLKKTGVFSSNSKTNTKIEVADDGSVVRLSLTEGKKFLKDYYFDVKNKKVTGDKITIKKIYKEDAAADESLASLAVNSNAIYNGKNQIAFLGYPTGVFMQEGDMTKNLSLVIYDKKTKKTTTTPLYTGYASLDQKKKGSQLTFKDDKKWYKQASDGSLYFDLDELSGTKGAKGTFGSIIIGNVFQTAKKTLTITFDAPQNLDTSLKPVLVLNSVDEKTEPVQVDLKKNQAGYTFKNLEKDRNYYIDYYPTKDSTDDKIMEKIDQTNKKLKVTVSN